MRLLGNRFLETSKEDFPNNFIHNIFVETPDGEVLGFADQLYEGTRVLRLDKKTSVFHRLDVPGIEKLGPFANDPRKSNIVNGKLSVERLGGLIITTKLTGSFLYKAGELKPYAPLNNIKTGNLAGIFDMPQLNAIVALSQEPMGLNIVFDDGRVISTDDFGLERGDFHAIRITENRILVFIYGSTRGKVLTKLVGRGPNTMYRYLIEVDPTLGLADPFRFADYMIEPRYPQVDGEWNEYHYASYPIGSAPPYKDGHAYPHPLKDQLGALFIKSRGVYLLQKPDGIYYDDGEGIGSKIEGSEKIHLIRVNDLPSLDLVLLDGGKYELTKDMRIVPLQTMQDIKGRPQVHIVEMPKSKVAIVFTKDGAYTLDGQKNLSLILGSKKTIGSGASLSMVPTRNLFRNAKKCLFRCRVPGVGFT